MLIAKLTAVIIAVTGVLYLIKIAWGHTHPEKQIINLENKLLKNLREHNSYKVMLGDWNLLCSKVKNGLVGPDITVAQRGAETIKLFIGEYFRGTADNAKLNIAIFRELAALYAVSIAQHPDIATEIVVALRVAAREIVESNEGLFDDIIRQFTLYGLLALREKRYYFTAKIFDQLFLLVPKCFNKGLTAQEQSVLRAISILGQGVIKRQDNGLAREIIARLRQSQETAGRMIHKPIYDMLLKSVRVSSTDTLNLLLETSTSIMTTENPVEVKETLRIWSEAAKNAAMKNDETSLNTLIAYMVQAAEQNLPGEEISVICLDELFAVITFAIRGKTVAEYGNMLLPVLELGCLCMQRELKYGFTDGAIMSYQAVLKRLLDKLLHLGAVVTRGGQISTGVWVAQLYGQWAQLPDNTYRKDALLKFVQLWLLYWASCQRKTAKHQGGLPEELFNSTGLSPTDLARFPNLHIRSM